MLKVSSSEKDIIMESTLKKNNKSTNTRGSKYRGVSRNGKAWQILMMIDQEKIYLGSMDEPRTAALIYDIAMI